MKPPFHHIRRVDRVQFHGWLVTLAYAGRQWTSYFRDQGGDEALERALAYRDRLLGMARHSRRGTSRPATPRARRPHKAAPPLW